MKLLTSDMWKSTKFVQWAISSTVVTIVFLVVATPIYIYFLKVLGSDMSEGSDMSDFLLVFDNLSDKLKDWVLLWVGVLVGNVSVYGILNQTQKRAPTEIIKARAKHGYSGPLKQDKSIPENFTGVYLDTKSHPNSTLGELEVYVKGKKQFSCMTIEQDWNDNKPNESCFPPGEYELVFEYSNKFGENLWEFKNVPGRSECKFHVANKVEELEGCVAPGLIHQDIDQDGDIDVKWSRSALNALHDSLRGHSRVTAIVRRDFEWNG